MFIHSSLRCVVETHGFHKAFLFFSSLSQYGIHSLKKKTTVNPEVKTTHCPLVKFFFFPETVLSFQFLASSLLCLHSNRPQHRPSLSLATDDPFLVNFSAADNLFRRFIQLKPPPSLVLLHAVNPQKSLPFPTSNAPSRDTVHSQLLPPCVAGHPTSPPTTNATAELTLLSSLQI